MRPFFDLEGEKGLGERGMSVISCLSLRLTCLISGSQYLVVSFDLSLFSYYHVVWCAGRWRWRVVCGPGCCYIAGIGESKHNTGAKRTGHRPYR